MRFRNVSWQTCSRLLASLLLALPAGLLPACSGAEGGAEETGVAQEELIGGVDAGSATLDAVGSLGLEAEVEDPSTGQVVKSYEPFCSASLIGDTDVLTARHCVDFVQQVYDHNVGKVFFAIGSDGRNPKRKIEVVEFERAKLSSGGVMGLGSDVGVVHLGEEVTQIRPLKLAELKNEDLGSHFTAIGYGVQDNAGTHGTRKAGTVTLRARSGKLYELIFGSFEAFKEYADDNWRPDDGQDPPAAGAGKPILAVPIAGQSSRKPRVESDPDDGSSGGTESSAGDPDDEWTQFLHEVYDTTLLLPDYEAWLGDAPGDAQTCYGDSGSPLVREVNGELRVYGVVSGGIRSERMVCDYGTVYATFGADTYAFLDKARTWTDPCAGISRAGVCEGAVAARCTSLGEGPRRVTRTDCSPLGQTCGSDAEGAVACVDPPSEQ